MSLSGAPASAAQSLSAPRSRLRCCRCGWQRPATRAPLPGSDRPSPTAAPLLRARSRRRSACVPARSRRPRRALKPRYPGGSRAVATRSRVRLLHCHRGSTARGPKRGRSVARCRCARGPPRGRRVPHRRLPRAPLPRRSGRAPPSRARSRRSRRARGGARSSHSTLLPRAPKRAARCRRDRDRSRC